MKRRAKARLRRLETHGPLTERRQRMHRPAIGVLADPRDLIADVEEFEAGKARRANAQNDRRNLWRTLSHADKGAYKSRAKRNVLNNARA